jgi:hypothetical protein
MLNDNYNFPVFQRAMPQLPQGENYNLQALSGAMPPLPQVVPLIPQVENYNLQVLQRAMTPLPPTNATFQQLLGLQPQQPYFYYNTQPSQVCLFSKSLQIDVSTQMPFTCINFRTILYVEFWFCGVTKLGVANISK